MTRTRRMRPWHWRDAAVVICGSVAIILILRGAVPVLFSTQNKVTRVVTIPRGSDLATITGTLHANGIIRSPGVFMLLARTLGLDRSLRAGQYELSSGMSALEILQALQRGSNFRVTIPEGLTAVEVADMLSRAIGLPRQEFLAAVRDSALRAQVDDPAATLDGYLFPDSYEILPDMTAREVVGQMVSRFEHVYEMEFGEETPPESLTRHEVVTLASIVEAESQSPRERPRIAAVYLNRLHAGMRLQADPTVAYALGTHRDRIYYRDLGVNSPYNTYRNPGLPPGPIANPGRASIHAVLEPLVGCRDLFFVARGDGTHEFTRTLAEHTAAIARIRGSGATLGVSIAAMHTPGDTIPPPSINEGASASHE